MKNPLNKRLPREFRKDFGKYLVIFLLLVITIGFVSGFLVADGSMIKAYNEGIDKYNTENGHFRTSEKMNDAQIQSVEENRIRIYDNFYLEQDLTNGSTMRIFAIIIIPSLKSDMTGHADGVLRLQVLHA